MNELRAQIELSIKVENMLAEAHQKHLDKLTKTAPESHAYWIEFSCTRQREERADVLRKVLGWMDEIEEKTSAPGTGLAPASLE